MKRVNIWWLEKYFVVMGMLALSVVLTGCGGPIMENDFGYSCDCVCADGSFFYEGAVGCERTQSGANAGCSGECGNACSPFGGVKQARAIFPASDGPICDMGSLTTPLMAYKDPFSTFEGLLDPVLSSLTLTNLDDGDSAQVEIKGEVTASGGNCLGSSCGIKITYAAFEALKSFRLSGKQVTGFKGINHGVWSGQKYADGTFKISPPSDIAVAARLDGKYNSVRAPAQNRVTGQFRVKHRNKKNSTVETNALIIKGSFVEKDIRVDMHLHLWMASCQPKLSAYVTCATGIDYERYVQFNGIKGKMLGNLNQKDLCNAIKDQSFTTKDCTTDPEFPCSRFYGKETVSANVSYEWKDAQGKPIGNKPVVNTEDCPDFPVTLTMKNQWGRMATKTFWEGPGQGACAPKCIRPGSCAWVKVGATASHSAGSAWCPEGSFLTQFDLDGDRNMSGHDAPIVGQAKCCAPKDIEPLKWKSCRWVVVGAQASHTPGPAWCPEGSFLTQFDLDGDRNFSGHDAPVVGRAKCCQPAGSATTTWNSCSWKPVGVAASHNPGRAWCPDGSFLTQFDLDGGQNNYAPHDMPIVGQAKCCK